MTDKDELREHQFDGIQEYDNDLPRWWLWLFALTVVFAAIYPFVYDFGPGEFATETVDREVAAARKAQQAGSSVVVSDAKTLLALVSDTNAVNQGREIFATRCAPCHAPLGQGLIGPNLTDDYWLHGGAINEIHHTVENGVLEKGMIAWKGQLSPEQINAVVAFVWTLHGTNPVGAKAPEGAKVERVN